MKDQAIRENREKMQYTLQKIGSLLARTPAGPWRKVVYGFFLTGEEGTWHQQLWSLPAGKGEPSDLLQDRWDDDLFLDMVEELNELCLFLQKRCAAAHDPWTEMSISLFPDGRFSVDFAYDKILQFDSLFTLDWQSRFLLAEG